MEMNQSVLAKGKNIQEAIELGLSILGTDKEKVSIEIIEKGGKGFWKIGSKQAIVRLTKLDDQETSSKQSSIKQDPLEQIIDSLEIESFASSEPIKENSLEGKVWIKDGKLYCQPASNKYPTVTVGKGIKLYKNGQLITGTTIVTEMDEYKIQTDEVVTEGKWDIILDSDKLHVLLQIEPGYRKTYKVKDIEPSEHIVLEGEEIVETIPAVDYNQILKKLEELRVIHGFNHNEIIKAIHTDRPGKFTIASGMKPKEGENGKIELLVDLNKGAKVKEKEDGTVDFREKQEFPSVEKGQVIAIVHPPVPGIPGITVTNEPLPPKPTYPLTIQPGKGIALIEQGKKILATETGRPLIEQRGLIVRVSILPKLVHSHDVNLLSGNIRFKGDLDVLGNVEEGMVVEADGNILIQKNVYGATISSKNAIAVHGSFIKSTISAGKQNIYSSELIRLLTSIQEQMDQLIKSIYQVIKLPAYKMSDYSSKGLQPLIKILLEKKFNNLLTLVKQYIATCNNGSHILELEWLTISEQLRLCFLSPAVNEYHTIEKINQLMQKITELLERKKNEQDDHCFVKLKYAQNSTIYSRGDIFITGQGCFNSKVYAGGTIAIKNVLRGGEIFSEKEVMVRESGSESGVMTKISVPSNGKIIIDHANEGTIIEIGKMKHVFHEGKRNIIAKLDKNGNLVF